jgi:hypothetical protein
MAVNATKPNSKQAQEIYLRLKGALKEEDGIDETLSAMLSLAAQVSGGSLHAQGLPWEEAKGAIKELAVVFVRAAAEDFAQRK